VATLPKPRYPSSGTGGLPVWPESRVYPRAATRPVVSASSSLLDLQAHAPVFRSEPLVPEPGVIADFSAWLKWAGEVLRDLGSWWLRADFRSRQVPVLVLALGIWVITARAAWQNQESATPLLRETIAAMRRQQRLAAQNAALSVPPPARVETSAQHTTAKREKPARQVNSQADRDVEKPAETPSNSLPSLIAASIRSFFSADPAGAEKVQGNPRRRVWVDMKTGLYYCPGAAYYGLGGRSRGKVMPQRAAEFEYFQPASGAPCQ
jgi:hypothetical protein